MVYKNVSQSLTNTNLYHIILSQIKLGRFLLIKYCFCDSESDILMTDGRCICLHYIMQKGLVTCIKIGKAIAEHEFHCNNICNDCIYEEEKNEKIFNCYFNCIYDVFYRNNDGCLQG